MQNWWTVRELGRMRQAEILKEAAIYRMVQQPQLKRQKFQGFLCLLLKRLGKVLVNWGSFLQKRSEATMQNPLP